MERKRSLQVRIALRKCVDTDSRNVDGYPDHDGCVGFNNALQMTPSGVIGEMAKSGLLERSGNGFPIAEKWRLCLDAAGSEKHVICNAAEGDPDSMVARTLLEQDPCSVLEGMLIGAYATGATLGWIYINAEYGLAVSRLRTALKKMEDDGLLGHHGRNSRFSFTLQIRETPGNLACSDETFLVNDMERRKTLPFVCSPRLPVYGLGGKATLIHEAETWAYVSAILEKGAECYAGFGTGRARGTKLFTLCGKVMFPGVVEVPLGTTLRRIIFDIGGGVPEDKDFKAVQVGGPAGGYLPASLLDLPVDYEHLSEAGTLMGSGTILVMDGDACILDHAKRSLSFLQRESCGKCVFCREGTMQMADILADMSEGKGKMDDIALLIDLGEGLKLGSQCHLGRAAPNPVLTTIRYFREELESHIKEQGCKAQLCRLERP